MKTKTTQCMSLEVTFINSIKTAEEIKKLLDADDVIVKENKIFDHTDEGNDENAMLKKK